ncbi:hypothetical protein SDC9_125808 [bioreactor metagenome]|uniref:Uncharacterized protein n=1 Tax=bioreactor metagenome TaxID=1076179 RepID=A0A645CPJ3_9ZZZZ
MQHSLFVISPLTIYAAAIEPGQGGHAGFFIKSVGIMVTRPENQRIISNRAVCFVTCLHVQHQITHIILVAEAFFRIEKGIDQQHGAVGVIFHKALGICQQLRRFGLGFTASQEKNADCDYYDMYDNTYHMQSQRYKKILTMSRQPAPCPVKRRDDHDT